MELSSNRPEGFISWNRPLLTSPAHLYKKYFVFVFSHWRVVCARKRKARVRPIMLSAIKRTHTFSRLWNGTAEARTCDLLIPMRTLYSLSCWDRFVAMNTRTVLRTYTIYVSAFVLDDIHPVMWPLQQESLYSSTIKHESMAFKFHDFKR